MDSVWVYEECCGFSVEMKSLWWIQCRAVKAASGSVLWIQRDVEVVDSVWRGV